MMIISKSLNTRAEFLILGNHNSVLLQYLVNGLIYSVSSGESSIVLEVQRLTKKELSYWPPDMSNTAHFNRKRAN